jgi:hypothetical protein
VVVGTLEEAGILDGVMGSASRRWFGRDELGCVWRRKHGQLYCIIKYPDHPDHQGRVDVTVTGNESNAIAGVDVRGIVSNTWYCIMQGGPGCQTATPPCRANPTRARQAAVQRQPWRAYATSPLPLYWSLDILRLKAREHSPEPRASTNLITLTGSKGPPSPNRQNAPSIRHLRRTSPRSPPPPAPHTKHPLPCKTPTN